MRSLLGNFVALCISLGSLGVLACSGSPFDGGSGGGGASSSGGDDASAGQDGGSATGEGGTSGHEGDDSSGGGGGTGDAGRSDAGHHDGGKSDAGGGGGTGASCTALSACCNDLGSQMAGGCMSIVSSGYEASCASALSSYHSGGYCTGGTHCATLASCCPSLPPGQGWQDTCNYYVDLNNDPQCESLYGTYQTDGYCN